MTKEEILEATINFTLEHSFVPDVHELASSLDIASDIIYEHFESSESICVFYFEHVLEEFAVISANIPTISELSFGECFAQFIFTSADLTSAHTPFSKIALGLIQSGLFTDSLIQTELTSLFESFKNQDTKISTLAHLITGNLFFNQLIRDWEEFLLMCYNSSISEDQWTERIDKYGNLLDSILHNDLPDKSFDYLKMLYQQSGFSLDRLFK